MKLCSIKNFFVRFSLLYALLFLLVSIFLAMGCPLKKISRSFKASAGDPAKKVGIAFFENKTFFKDMNLENVFQEYLTESIMEFCDGLLLVKPGDAGYPDFLEKLPRQATGGIDNLRLARLGRQIGLNAVVTATLMGMTGDEEDRGIWWFKDSHQFINVQIKIEVYDTETGTKLIDESYDKEVEIDALEFEIFRKKKMIGLSGVDDAFTYIAEDMGERICNAVIIPPWKGYITSVTEDSIIISSGEKVGLVPGTVLEVYNAGEIIEGIESHQFLMPGRKTGEIRVTEVYADSCKAVLITGSGISEGSSVKTKK